MDTLNLVGVILGIVASLGTIATLCLQYSKNKVAQPLSEPTRIQDHSPPSKPVQSSSTPRQYGPIALVFRKGIACFWGIVGAGALLEGWEFGEMFLMLLGIAFLYFAYRLWPKELQLIYPERL